ncbi:MAG: WG repeat-containing protein [Candidatus Brocadiia bacterium]
MTSRGSMFRRLSASALLTAALLILLSFTEADLARFAGPVPFATVTLSGDGGKWVVINRKGERQGTGAFVYAGGFSEGLAAVCDGLGWGYVDNKGVLVIPCKFSRAGEFHDGFAPVRVVGRDVIGGYSVEESSMGTGNVSAEISGGWHYVTKSGQFAFERSFDYAEPFHEGEGKVLIDGYWAYLSRDGHLASYRERHPTTRPRSDAGDEPVVCCDETGMYGFKLGDNWITAPEFTEAEEFRDGMAAVKENGRWGFIDLTGKIVVETDFDRVESFKNGFAAVKINGKWGLVRKNGTYLAEPIYDEEPLFAGGKGVLTLAGKDGVIDGTGKIVVPFTYDGIFFGYEHWQDRDIAFTRIRDKFGFVRADGAIISPPVFDEMGLFENGYACVKKDGAWNVIDRQGLPQYDIPLDRAQSSGDWVLVTKDGKKGVFNTVTGAKSAIFYDDIDRRGDRPLTLTIGSKKQLMTFSDCREVGPEFDEIRWPHEGMTAFKTAGLWGFLDSGYNIAVRPAYLAVESFSNGLAAVKTTTGWGYVDTTGKMVIGSQYAEVKPWGGEFTMVRTFVGAQVSLIDPFGESIGSLFEAVGDFTEGLAPAKRSGKWGYIDTGGNTRVPMHFDEAGDFAFGLAPVRLAEKWGYVDHCGVLAIPAEYDSADKFREGLALVSKAGIWSFLDGKGTLVLGPFDAPVLAFKDGFAWTRARDREWVPFDLKGIRDYDHGRWDADSEMEYSWRNGDLFVPRVGFTPEIACKSVGPASEGFRCFAAKTDAMHGIRSIDGTTSCPPRYEHMRPFSCGLAQAKLNERYLFVRPDGSIAFFTPEGTTSAGDYKDGFAWIRTQKGANFLDLEGHVLCERWLEGTYDFSEGLATVVEDGLWGYVDLSGNVAIPPRFRFARPFSSGLAVVQTLDGWTAIDKSGKEQFVPLPDEVTDFSGGFACSRSSSAHWFFDRKGERSRTRFTLKVGFPDVPAELNLDTATMQNVTAWGNNGEFATVTIAGRGCFLLNLRTGNALSVASCNLCEGLGLSADLVIASPLGKSDKFGAVDKDLCWVFPPEFSEMKCFSEGLAYAERDGVTGYIDVNGNWAFTLPIDDGEPFRHGVALIYTKQGSLWINRQGKKATLADADNDDARYESFKAGRAGYFDLKGRVAIPAWFAETRTFSQGLASVRSLDGLWGFIDKSGAYIIQPKFTETGDFSEGLAAVLVGDKQNGLWTFVDRKGNQIHEPYFDEVRAFHQGLAAVRRGALWGYMDKHGQMVFPLQFDAAGDFMLEEAK